MFRLGRRVIASSALALALGAATTVAHADTAAQVLPVSVNNPYGLPGSTVFTRFTMDFSALYNLVSFDMWLDYAPGQLTFDQNASSLQYGSDAPVNLLDAMQALAAIAPMEGVVNPLVVDQPGQFSASFFLPFGTLALEQPVTLHAAFSIDASVPLGTPTQVHFHGLASQELPELGLSDDSFSRYATVSVSAIPEPAHWLMLVLGLTTIALAGRRRIKYRF